MSHLDEGQLTLLLDGELSPEARAEAERHLAGCADCRRLYQEVRDLAGEADRLVATVEPAVRPAPAVQPSAPRPRRAWERWRPLAWAATLVLAAGLGWYARLGHLDGAPAADRLGAARAESAKAADLPDNAPRPPEPAAPLATLPEATTRDGPAASSSAARPAEAQPAAPPPAVEQAQPAEAPVAAAPAPAPRRDAEAVAGTLAAGNALEARRERAPAAAGASRAVTTAEAPLAARDEVSSKQAVEDAAVSPARSVSLEQAIRVLGGSIRLVDGMTPVAVRTIPGRGVPGAEPDAVVVRIVYLDPPGRELWLDQQRPGPAEPEAGARSAPALLPGDTLVSALADGQRRLRWRDPEGFHLSLAGWLSGDSLKALARRVR
ncbi:MAG: zf-HC2 domain-containing protein [Gemmatimonadetes bacterium]|nr:zf-HC2 domain-containing protein [Gemmatimonadota bacterium]